MKGRIVESAFGFALVIVGVLFLYLLMMFGDLLYQFPEGYVLTPAIAYTVWILAGMIMILLGISFLLGKSPIKIKVT